MSLVVPFSNNPASVVEKSNAGYTIPVNQYARVTVQVDSDGDFIVDGTTVLSAGSVGAVTIRVTSTTRVDYTVPSDSYFEGYLTYGNVGFSYSVGNTNADMGLVSSNHPSVPIKAGPSQQIYSTAASGTKSLHGTVRTKSPAEASGAYWLPSGAVITVNNNCRYLVELYNVIQ